MINLKLLPFPLLQILFSGKQADGGDISNYMGERRYKRQHYELEGLLRW